MKTRVLLLLVGLFSVLLLGLHVSMKKEADPEDVRQAAEIAGAPAKWLGRVPPPFEITLLDGSTFRLSEHVGREVVLINFFATWCEPCREEMPELVRFEDRNSSKPFRLLPVDAGEERALAEKFLADYHVKSSAAIDTTHALRRVFGVKALPTSVLIGADGRVLLYESAAILNADVSLQPLVTPQFEAIAAGHGISREQYEIAAKSENLRDVVPPQKDPGVILTGRAKSIAERMGCLCGCSNKLKECGCQTAKGMKERLKTANLDGKTDDEVAKELGKEFCMKGM